MGETRTSGRKADKVQYDWSGGATGALPDVDRSGPVADLARIGSMSGMDFQAALPEPKGQPCRAVWLSGEHSQLGYSVTTAACMRVMVGFSAAQGNALLTRLSPWPQWCPG